MSEQFRSLRHLTVHVEEQIRIYTQLQDAIRQVSGLLDSLPEKERHLKETEEKLLAAQKKIIDAEAAQLVLLQGFKQQRQELQEIVHKEQQDRNAAREAFKTEQHGWHTEIQGSRSTLSDLQRQIVGKRDELQTLQRELDSTVKAVLRR